MKIGIMGNGIVGQATSYAYRDIADVYRYDKDHERGLHTIRQVNECDIVFVCVPEYEVECAIWMLVEPCFIVIKSTTPVGVTRELQQKYQRHTIVHSPEFLTERTSLYDAEHPRVNIIGIPNYQSQDKPQDIRGDEQYNRYYSLLQRKFLDIPLHVMSSDESEAVKLFLNSFFAVKVSLFNEFHELADKLNLDWEVVISTMVTEGRMTPTHTAVPGPDGKYGFGGRCLPKDLWNLIGCMLRNQCNPQVMQAVAMRNIKDREGRK
jgi:UDP-glucose 6-dehydrogenase